MGVTEPIADYLKRRALEVNASLANLLPPQTIAPQQLHEAMSYSLLAGGKRLRPILVLTTGEAMGAATAALMPIAGAIEMIHTYSLIHDDLPAMDNDDLRRGKPTCHKVFGEALAILAGDALLTQAFHILATHDLEQGASQQLLILQEIAKASGAGDGLISGQVVDLASEGQPIGTQTLEYIHRAKTGALLCAAVTVGGLAAGANLHQLQQLRAYGERIGLAFQIVDDILDIAATSEELGKTAGKDVAAQKATYPALHGLPAAQAQAQALIEEAIALLKDLNLQTPKLAELAQYIIARTF